jgi:hypothetical protein
MKKITFSFSLFLFGVSCFAESRAGSIAPGASSTGLAIGTSINSGNPYYVLYESSSNKLAQSTDFAYYPVTSEFVAPNMVVGEIFNDHIILFGDERLIQITDISDNLSIELEGQTGKITGTALTFPPTGYAGSLNIFTQNESVAASSHGISIKTGHVSTVSGASGDVTVEVGTATTPGKIRFVTDGSQRASIDETGLTVGVAPVVVTLSTSAISGTATTTGTSMTLSVTVPAGSNRLLAVYIGDQGGFGTVSVTYGGVPLTMAVEGVQAIARLYYLVAPAVGTDNLIATGLTANTPFSVMKAVVFNGANQSTPFGTILNVDTLFGLSFPQTVTTPTGSIVFDFQSGVSSEPNTPGTGQQIVLSTPTVTPFYTSSVKKRTGATTNMTWADDGGNPDYIAAPVLEAAGSERVTGTLSITGVFQVVAVATQTIVSSGTIAADQCGGVKRISSAGVVKSSTTTTFATGTSGIQCEENVCNVGSYNITLDYNSGFLSFGATDVLLTPNDCVDVAFDGVVWRQLAPVSVN